MVGAFTNMFRIPELRKKIFFTVMILIIYRLGSLMPAPGVDVDTLGKWFAGKSGGGVASIFGMVTMLSGGNLQQATVFALGIMPYISATIIFQLLTGVIPTLERLRKEGESGMKKIRQYERYTTLGLCLVQGSFLVQWLAAQTYEGAPLFAPGPIPYITAIVTMATGTMLLVWLGDQVTQHGVGNGISLIIMAGIVARLPVVILRLWDTGADVQVIVGLIVGFVVVVSGVVLITQGQRRIPVQQAKHTRGRRVYGGQRQYLPFRVNHAGVMPVIFASTLLIFPTLIVKSLGTDPTIMWISANVIVRGSWVYVLTFVGLIYFFSYFWTSLQFKPKDLSDNLKDYGSFIPGIRPGPRTASYLENVMVRITLAGATFLAAIAILPMILQKSTEAGMAASFLGGTSILIVVGVALDLVEKIESHLMMRHYEGFMRKGKIRGRR